MTQLSFDVDWREIWNGAETTENVGSVYTRLEIVDLILDLAGYRADVARLAARPLLEPSCGDGAFLKVVLDRLLASEARHTKTIRWNDSALDGAIRAVDIDLGAVTTARGSIETALKAAGCPRARAQALARTWASQDDFLLARRDEKFSFVVGNPPYVRLEDLPKRVLAEYRSRFPTLTDRADLYVAFFERGLDLLATDGALAFICANRFTKNQYGAALRKMIASRYRVRHYVNLEHTQPFVQNVSAYPAIIVIDRQHGKPTQAGTLDELGERTLSAVRRQGIGRGKGSGPLATFGTWYPDGRPWSTTSSAAFSMLGALETKFPILEESSPHTKVGIGVATGADEAFVLPGKSATIEDEHQLPLLMASDIRPDGLNWSGSYLVNPFSALDDGQLVDLKRAPGLARHFAQFEEQLRKRHVAKDRSTGWYRTIDRVWTSLLTVPKLVIPDIQSGGVTGCDSGQFYPHHNLYWISSEEWDLLALQALLRSSFVLMQVRAFSVQMRGGSIRYQAQTLRRVRIPSLATLSEEVIKSLRLVAASANQAEIDKAAEEAFGLPILAATAA